MSDLCAAAIEAGAHTIRRERVEWQKRIPQDVERHSLLMIEDVVKPPEQLQKPDV